MSNNSKPVTIGLLVGGILDDFTSIICKGVCREAEKFGARVIIFPGKYIDRDLSAKPELTYEYQFNSDFMLPSADNLDAIVGSTGSIGYYATDENMSKLLAHYNGIPIVQIASHLPEYSSVAYDNRAGILDGLSYAYDQGSRHFGMIGANIENSDARERKETFFDFLRSKDIAFEDHMYTEANSSCIGKEQKYNQFLDAYPEMDTVFCINDGTALEFYNVLKARGIIPGKDISVIGYDDTLAAARATPSLSSVWAEGDKLGEQAVDLALSLIDKNEITHKRITTRFIKRESIKTIDPSSISEDKKVGFTDSVWFSRIFYRYHDEYDMEAIEHVRRIFKDLFTQITEISSPHKAADERMLMHMLYCLAIELVDSDITRYADIENLLQFLGLCMQKIDSSLISESNKLLFTQKSRSIYCDIIEDFNQRSGELVSEYKNESHNIKLFSQSAMQFNNGNDSNYASILKSLSWFGFTDAALYVLDHPLPNYDKQYFRWPEYVNKKAVIKCWSCQNIPVSEQKVRINDIWNNSVSQPQVVFPLFAGELVYGIIICNLNPIMYSSGEYIVITLGLAVKMMDLLKTNEEIQHKLDAMSKQDGLTNILNRRGFNEIAESMRISQKQKGRSFMMIFVDMNNLKLVNDQFGHEEGDFALKKISEVLAASIAPGGIAGRIGGDEFACIVPDYENGDEKLITDSIDFTLNEFNRTKKKRYLITVSAGCFIYHPDETLSVEDALTKADERMYEVKRLRKKEILNDI